MQRHQPTHRPCHPQKGPQTGLGGGSSVPDGAGDSVCGTIRSAGISHQGTGLMTIASLCGRLRTDSEVQLYAGIIAFGCIEDLIVSMLPGYMPFWMPYEFSWGVYLSVALSVAWYARGIGRLDRPVRPRRWRSILFILGVGLIYASMQSKLDYAAQHMFFIHRLQHLILHHTGPFLIALSWPG